jgi:hypothetical protein
MTKPTIPELPQRVDADEQATKTGAKSATHHLQVNISEMPLNELLELRSRIDQLLPARNLKDIDLEQELVLQLMATQELQRSVLADSETPANQLAQVSNAVQAALQNLVKLQGAVHTSERLKRIEVVLIDTINKHFNAEQAEAFFAAYRVVLGERV